MTYATDSTTGRARWSALAALGLAMPATAAALLLIAGLIWGLSLGEIALFLAIPIAVGGGSAFLVYRFGVWAKILGIVAAVLCFLTIWWTAFGIGLPNSFFDFVPGVLVVPGVIIAISSSIAALVAGRRGHRGTVATGGEARGLRLVALALALLVVFSGVLSLFTRSTADTAKASATIHMKDFKFSPKAPSIAGGSTILLVNDDPFYHDFRVKALGIKVGLTPGSKKLVAIPATAGTYPFYCQPHGSEDPAEADEDSMNGTLTVSGP